MKHHLKIIIPAAAVVLLAGMALLSPVPIYISTSGSSGTKLLVEWLDQSLGATNPAVKFTPDLLDPLVDPNLNSSDNDPFYRYFLDLDDGQYKIGNDITELNNFQYVYGTTSDKFPYLEVAYAYDKDKKKKQNLARLGSGGGGGVGQVKFENNRPGTNVPMPLAVFPVGKHILLKSTGSAVADDFFTVVLTYDNPGAIVGPCTLHVDFSGMVAATPRPPKHGNFISATVTNTSMEFTVPAFTPTATQRNIFLHFYPQKPTSTVESSPVVSISAHFKDDTGIMSASDPLQQLILDSHDPNGKSAVQKKICSGDNVIKYFVHFQNNGKGDANTIRIKDELDRYLIMPAFVNILNYDTKLVQRSSSVDNAKRELEFLFNNVQLKGTGDPRYGIDFGYDKTEAWFSFEVAIDDNISNCNAICNNARIFFDENTPIETGTTITPISCVTCDSSCIVPDTAGLYLPPTINPVPTTFSSAFPNFYTSINAMQFTHFKWYPSKFVSDWDDLETVFTAPRPTVYTLIASKNCERYVFQFFYDRNCFDLSYNTPALACADAVADITANVISADPGSMQTNWLWSNGGSGSSATFTNLTAGANYIGITDQTTGCYKEIKVNITAPPPIYIQDNPNDNKANLIVTGGTPGYSYQYSIGGGSTVASPNPTMQLNGATSFTVTVTDHNGCTAVFAGKGSNKIIVNGGLTAGEIVLIAAAMLAMTLFIMYILNRQSPSNPG